MKASSLLFLVFGFFTLSLAAQQQAPATLHPAGPNRPAEVPADFVITPFGYFHPSCVLQLNKGEYRSARGSLHHADGSETQIAPCQYAHFSPVGSPISSGEAAPLTTASQNLASTVEPAISHSWIEESSVIATSAYGEEVSTWTVPPIPLMHDGQTIYFFPGFQDHGDTQSILQPVIHSYNGGYWTMSSWNCCLAGTADESTPVDINPGDTIVGTTQMTCTAGTSSCGTWNVIAQDQTTSQSTELTATPSDGQSFNWAFGAVLEVYNVDQCLDYPPNASLTISSLLYDNTLNLISSPNWGVVDTHALTVQPQCDYGVTTTATQTTLQYGTTAPAFGVGVQPAAGIAVNQGSSASGTITITDINGFNGSVQVSLSNPPTGVTAQLAQGASPNTYILTLSATGAAPITGANLPAIITVTASGSGVSTQTFPLNVIVNPPLSGGVGTLVDLTSEYNAYAFFNDSVGPPTLNSANSLDNSGDVYSANQLSSPGVSPMTLNVNGEQFSFGIPDQRNAVYGTGSNPISLPNIQSNGLQLLATGVNGAQKLQTVVVTYTDSTTQTFTQSFDDWLIGPTCSAPNVCTPGESVAVTMPYNDTRYAYPRNDSIYYLYEYSFALNSSKTLSSLALPNNRDVAVLAVTLANVTATPTFSPATSAIVPPQSVTLTDSTPGATIYYTTNNSAPTTSSSVYTGPITVSSTETLQAIATASGYIPSSIATATYTVVPPGFSITGTAISITPGATTGDTSTITVTPSGGFTGPITLSCAILPVAGSDPATCSIPASTTISGSAAQTVVLTVNTTAAGFALNRHGGSFWPSAGGTALACILIFGLPPQRRRGWSILGAVALSFCIIGGALGCGGSSSGGGSSAGNPGTTPGTYSITVTGSSGSITQQATVSLSLL